MRRALVAAAAALTLAFSAQAAPERWDLKDLYPTLAAWEDGTRAFRERVDGLERLREGFGRDAKSLLAALGAISDANREMSRLWVYASLQADEDLREPRAQERKQQVQSLYARLGEKTAWLSPAIQALGRERVNAYLAAEPELKARFDLQLDDALRNAPHTLTPEGEALLAAASPVLAQPGVLFEQMSDAELPLPKVKLSGGRTVQLTGPVFEQVRTSAVRADRKAAFDGFFGTYKKAEGSFGANLNTQVLAEIFGARTRRHAGSLDAALFSDNMPPAVYRTLVAQANAGLPTLHRYLKLRQRVLGIQGPLAYYDNYPPLVPVPKGVRWDLDGAKAVTLEALAPLGDEYLGHLQRGFAARWSDSHPRPGKATGAYMAGSAYDVHPYVLLNHGDDFESLSTLAHEWGHAVHTLLSNAQPFEKSGYSTFIAESASIGNEMMLSDHLIANAKTPAEKRFYIAQALETIRTTFFRQVMFAEFQLAIHEEVEQGRALSGARLSELYCGIARRYYGESAGVMKIDPTYCVEWAYIPHFYRGFYVWQYATSIAGAAQFTDAIRREGAPARDRFITLLKAGNADYAYPLYVKAGVDLAQPAPYEALMARMARLMDEFERLARAK